MELRTYLDPEDLFKVEVPRDWQLVETSRESDFRVVFYAPPDQTSDFRSNCSVLLVDVPNLTNEEYVIMNRLQLKQLSGGETLDRDESLDTAHVFEWINNETSTPWWVRNQLFFGKGNVLTVSASCPNHQKEKFIGIFDSIFRSFKLDD